MEFIRCPFHPEDTASCALYPKAYHCFGCGAHGPLSEIGRVATEDPPPKPKENLKEKLEYIYALPKKTLRGFDFHCDDRSYFILWPDGQYYKRRNFSGEPKYVCPTGHTKPEFWVRREGYATLAICEGEINAMSIGEAFPRWDVVSPGSASDFKTPRTKEFLLTYCTSYSTVVIVTDRDGPGTEAAIVAKGILVGKVKSVEIVLMSPDANEILCSSGKETLKEEIKRGLPKGVQREID